MPENLLGSVLKAVWWKVNNVKVQHRWITNESAAL